MAEVVVVKGALEISVELVPCCSPGYRFAARATCPWCETGRFGHSTLPKGVGEGMAEEAAVRYVEAHMTVCEDAPR